ncbi:Lysine-specific histone demethylase 1-like protein 3 [Hibiscus syriacus]|uniref:Lysine-specific histone demethylase 1-like protein 3 n=1 Tax=Hibiscus syriacus TaxID=106335 RepID=A0A6A3AZ36_HIBSY|nr:Lysine-specific histone demethylase 1-like protein 3 [Hibiscus syriacus]
MNSSNQTSDDSSEFPIPHVSLFPPLPNPIPNTNFHPIPNPNVSLPPDDHIHSLPVPQKRRRGRPQRNAPTTSSFQLLNSPNGSFNLNLSVSNPNLNHNSMSSSSAATTQTTQPKIDDEIIVINKESTAEALTALSAGFPADYLTEEEIDFGVVSSVGGIEQEKIPAEPSRSKVIIIGAGLAGLTAARQLMGFGFKVTVLEGRKRAGGRVYTKKMEGGNRVRDKCPLYRMDGSPVDRDMDFKVEKAFNRLLDKASKLRKLMGEVSMDVSLGAALETFREVYGDAVTEEEISLFNWHLANLEYANAGLVSKLSLAFWDQDDPYDMGGDHCFLPGGNGRLVQALAENVPILYEKTVHTIRYGSDGVQVMAGAQVYEGDMALCTVPLGVLKSGSIKFAPELPQRKLDAIKRLGFGLLNKVGMLFPHVFWGTDLDTFGYLTKDPSHRGEFFLFYSYATVASGPLLLALVAGEAAHRFETQPPIDAVAQVLQILKGIYEPQGITVPEPLQTVCTRWGGDPFSLGSYSNVAVGASGDDYDILAESVGDGRLFFAGEATTRRYPATMHGAFLTGLREAANMAQYVNSRTAKKKIDRSPSNTAHSCASILTDLFREPDLEFGSFSVIFGRKNADPKSPAILRVTISELRKKNQESSMTDQQHSNKVLFQQLQSHFNQQQLHVYTLLSKKQALDLREVRGGDEMRLNYLCEKLRIKLVGRKGLGPTVNSVIASIKAQRGLRKPSSSPLALKSGASMLKTGNFKHKFIRKAKIVRKTKGMPPPIVNAVNGDPSEEIKMTKQAPLDSSSSGQNQGEMFKQ